MIVVATPDKQKNVMSISGRWTRLSGWKISCHVHGSALTLQMTHAASSACDVFTAAFLLKAIDQGRQSADRSRVLGR